MTLTADANATSRTARAPRWVLATIAAAAAVLIAAGIVAQVRAHDARSGGGDSNRALSDPTSTAQVIGQVSNTMNKVLSYSYLNPAATKTAASTMLTGDAARQYATLFAALQKKAPGEKLTLHASVVSAGVSSLTGSTAQLLIFLNQSSTRASDKATATAAAQVEVTAVRHGQVWTITELVPL